MRRPRVAYFTMEIALEPSMPTFAGGLGVLAADLLRSTCDLRVDAVGMTVCWQHGYLEQHIRHDGTQEYRDIHWNPSDHLRLLPERVTVEIEKRPVTVGAWVYELKSRDHTVPIYFLDTNLPENRPEDREITNALYGGDHTMRLKQETVLGIGGVRMLRAIGHEAVGTYHMNEGHTAFLTLELLRERGFKDSVVRPSCSFTTHTPVAAGHDVFPYDLAWKIVGDMLPWHIKALAGDDALSMTKLAMHLSHFTCAVSAVHAQVSRQMFPGEAIDAITNGIHHVAWAGPQMQSLLDHYAPDWRQDPTALTRFADACPDRDLWEAHQEAKRQLLALVNRHTETPFHEDILTIASARRVVPYKRPELLYTNLERLREIGGGKLQIIHAGNAHPRDPFSQDVIRRMVERSKALRDSVKIVYLENYNTDLAHLLVAGADVWLNTPMRLHEASGTSGMKACLNGVINVSTLDGWWIEGYALDPEAGWRIGPLASALPAEEDRLVDAEDLYTQLQYQVIPAYYHRERARWIRHMKRSIALISHFNTHRAVCEYMEKAWRETTPGG